MVYKKGQYVVCRNRGDNGDLVVGRVKSFRVGGYVVLENFFRRDGKPSLKKTTVLDDRNVVVSKADAMKVVTLYQQTGDRQKARELAVNIASEYVKRKPLTREHVVRRVVESSESYSLDDEHDREKLISRLLTGLLGVK